MTLTIVGLQNILETCQFSENLLLPYCLTEYCEILQLNCTSCICICVNFDISFLQLQFYLDSGFTTEIITKWIYTKKHASRSLEARNRLVLQSKTGKILNGTRLKSEPIAFDHRFCLNGINSLRLNRLLSVDLFCQK